MNSPQIWGRKSGGSGDCGAGKAENPQKGWALGQGAGSSSGRGLGTSGARDFGSGKTGRRRTAAWACQPLAVAAFTLMNF